MSPRHYTKQFGCKIAGLLEVLKPPCDYVGHSDAVDPLALWASWEWDDMWNDADMRSLIVYLYGGVKVKIPHEWKKILPKQI